MPEKLYLSAQQFLEDSFRLGALVLESVRQGKRPGDWNEQQLHEIAPEFDAEAVELLSARRALENHTPPGGTAPETVRRAVERARRRLSEMRESS